MHALVEHFILGILEACSAIICFCMRQNPSSKACDARHCQIQMSRAGIVGIARVGCVQGGGAATGHSNPGVLCAL